MVPYKITWLVSPEVYRKLERRNWPRGIIGRRTIVELLCADEYTHQKVRSGDHSEIRIRIIFRKTPYYLKKRGKTLAEAKEIAQKFISTNPKIAKEAYNE